MFGNLPLTLKPGLLIACFPEDNKDFRELLDLLEISTYDLELLGGPFKYSIEDAIRRATAAPPTACTFVRQCVMTAEQKLGVALAFVTCFVNLDGLHKLWGKM